MKESLYTIPVNDAFDEGGECPFCNMLKALEKDSIDYTLGASYMEDDIRAETDKTGFCKRHYNMMYQKQNRLGMALIIQTHLQNIVNNIENLSNDFITEKKGLFSKAKTENKLSPYLDNITNSCYICNRIETNFDRYFDTFFYMWKKDNDIKNKVKNSNGFCIDHFSKLISLGNNKLSSKEFKEFKEIIISVEIKNLNRLSTEIEHFINKFDHNNTNLPWGTARDSLIRSILKISSEFVEE